MKIVFYLLIVTFCYTAGGSALSFPAREDWNDSRSKRTKRQDDRWDWGYVVSPETTPKSEPTTPNTSSKFQDNANPCLNRNFSSKPDFDALGKRISVTKCFEYIWEVKHRDEMDKRNAECIQSMMKHRHSSRGHFVVGGRNIEPGEFPHMGAVGWKAAVGTWVFKCGSSLISSKFVLTAAHCSSASSRDTTLADPIPKIVRLGDKNIIDKFANGVRPKDEKIIRIIVHPEYTSPKQYFDIALMELEKEVTFTQYIQPACLLTNFDSSSIGTKATITGWGVVQSSSLETSPELQAAEVDVIDNQQCDRLLRPSCNRNWCGIQMTQMCAGKLAGGVDTCQGDSGGPLQVKIPLPITTQGAMHNVIGVTSFGIKCAFPNLPGVYTRVSSFIDWIESNVWQ